MTQPTEPSSRWTAYYAKTAGRPPRPTLVFALDRFEEEERIAPRRVVDLGAGGGRDVVELLRRGWQVHAVDSEPTTVEALRACAAPFPDAVLETVISDYADARLPQCDLVNSSFALPICEPAVFDELWQRIRVSLLPGGRFAGQLFGPRDSWAGRPHMTFHTRAEVKGLLDGFNIEFFEEEEDDSVTPRGEKKRWHVFHVVAKKKQA